LHPFSYHDPPEGFTSQPGSVGVWSLNRGEEIKPFVNTAPAESYDKFVDSFAAYLSASTGVPVEMMLMRFNSNYSASRAALILFWRIARIWQHEMAVDFLDIVIMSWLSEEIAAGRMTAPGWSDPILRAAWLNGTWHGIPLPNIDPVKTAKADVIDVHQLNAKDLDRVARERGGEGRRTRALLNRQFKEMAQSPLNKTTTNR
jgi:capsid protein